LAVAGEAAHAAPVRGRDVDLAETAGAAERDAGRVVDQVGELPYSATTVRSLPSGSTTTIASRAA
jgi:hypothetical protein